MSSEPDAPYLPSPHRPRSASADEQRTAGPWGGLALAAQAAADHLHHQSGWDLCLVSTIEGDDHVVVASAGPWQAFVRPGDRLNWSTARCSSLIGAGVAISHLEQRPGAVELNPLTEARSYAGAPLMAQDGRLFGTLCMVDRRPAPPELTEVFEGVRVMARMLSTIRAREEVAADRSAAAAQAYALATRDSLTGLLNRRGWADALEVEEHRARRYGRAVSVIVADVDGLKQVNDSAGHRAGDQLLVGCAHALIQGCRPGDVPARIGGDEFAVLAVECDIVSARALGRRLRVELLRAGVVAAVGYATRRVGEDLADTVHRADREMYRTKRRHRDHQPVPLSSGRRLRHSEFPAR